MLTLRSWQPTMQTETSRCALTLPDTMQSNDQNVFTKLGPYAWLAGAILATETLIVIKFGREEFTAPFPERVKIFWAAFFSVLAVVMVIWQLTLWTSSYMRKGKSGKQVKRA
jgi:formate/nitrite transporter FocA (FNT family)